jgi:hypothetical protein
VASTDWTRPPFVHSRQSHCACRRSDFAARRSAPEEPRNVARGASPWSQRWIPSHSRAPEGRLNRRSSGTAGMRAIRNPAAPLGLSAGWGCSKFQGLAPLATFRGSSGARGGTPWTGAFGYRQMMIGWHPDGRLRKPIVGRLSDQSRIRFAPELRRWRASPRFNYDPPGRAHRPNRRAPARQAPDLLLSRPWLTARGSNASDRAGGPQSGPPALPARAPRGFPA